MSNDPFSDPAKGGNGANITDFEGKLLLITPTEHVEGIATEHGEKDAIRANVVVIDESNPVASERYDDVLMFQARLIGATKGFVGKGMVIGRLERASEKVKGNYPWQLATATDAEKDKARAYIASVAPAL